MTETCSHQLDEFALLASQPYNVGNSDNWFFSFRAGLKGTVSRLKGLHRHSRALHSWLPPERLDDREHHIAVMLFCMDSAMECFVFALNALGQAVKKGAFRDVASRKALSGISPRDLIGQKALMGYAEFFPAVQNKWQAKAALIELIVNNHDVSKHRQSCFWGGTLQDDPPAGFAHALGLEEDDAITLFAPMKEVLIPKDPKAPMNELAPDLAEWTQVEQLEEAFVPFIIDSFCAANTDARTNIRLTHSKFKT